ncbi:MAG: Phytoene synthase, partial [uncultured Acidimicrobiales bacterium]
DGHLGRVVRGVSAAQQALRQHVLLVDLPAPPGQAAPRACPVRVLPLRRRHRGRPRPRSGDRARPGPAGLRRALLRRPRAGHLGRPRAQGGGAHGAGLRHRSGLLPSVPAVDGHGPVDRLVRDVGGPARLHGRFGGGHRRDDASDPRAAVAGLGAGAGPGARQRVPADQLPAGHRRGPRPGTGLRAPGRHPEVRRGVRLRRAPGDARPGGPAAVRDRAVPGALCRRRAGGRAAPPIVGALHRRGSSALLPHPRAHRGPGLRRLRRPRPGADPGEAGGGRPARPPPAGHREGCARV